MQTVSATVPYAYINITHVLDVPYVYRPLVGVPKRVLSRELPRGTPLARGPVSRGRLPREAALDGGAGCDDPRPDEHHGLPAHRQQLLLGLPLRVELAHVHAALQLACIRVFSVIRAFLSFVVVGEVYCSLQKFTKVYCSLKKFTKFYCS